MEGTKSNKNKKATANTSKKTKKIVNEVSSDELLEQILSKKKTAKKSSTKKSTTVSSANKSTTSKKRTVKKTKQFNTLENDFIYDQILSNKASKAKSTKSTKKKETKTNVVKDKVEDVVVDKTKTIEELEALLPVEFEEEKYDTYNSLEESVKRKKEQKDEFELFLTEIENEKLLKQIRQALEEDKVEYIQPDYKVHSKDAIATIDSEINERIKKRALGDSSKKKNNVLPILLIIGILLCVGIILCVVVNCIVSDKELEVDNKDKVVDLDNSKALEEQKLAEEYNSCINRELDEYDVNTELQGIIDNMNVYFNNTYKLSVLYTDLNTGYSYGYNTNQMYYAASTMKTLGALYVYEKAYNGEIDLDTELVYSKSLRMGSSAGMKNHKIGSKITLRELVKYSITLSDNTAHNMIINYVGIDNVRNYGLSMGATLSHTNYDLFGYINVSDAKIYLDKLYYLINNTDEYGAELEEYFLIADQNYLDFKDNGISAVHKYGEYENIYHDIGIVYDEHPYSVVILTNEGRKDHETVIRDINSKVYELHNMFYTNRETYCSNLVYGK